jgi:hypothetical protein
MAFSIQFTGLQELQNDSSSEAYLSGIICLGDFQEEFSSSLSHWTRDDYENQWREGVERILSGQFNMSAIFVDFMSPNKTGSTLTWWPMYLQGDSVCFQEHFLELDKLSQGLKRKDLYNYIQSRQKPDLDSPEPSPSEWIIKRKDLEQWLINNKNA